MKHFTDAIGVDAANHVFYSNRSAAYAALNDFDAALNDAEKTVAIKPDWVKGHSRKGAALYGLKRYDDACAFRARSPSLPRARSPQHSKHSVKS